MKPTRLFVFLLLALAAGHLAAQPAPAQSPAPESPAPATTFTEAQLLETFGWYVGQRIGVTELEFGPEQLEAILRGIRHAATGEGAPYDIDAIGPQLDEYMMAKQNQYAEKMRQKSQAESAAFMEAARAKPGAQVLPSGLVYEVIQPGTGEFPTAADTVQVHYTGTLADGTVFDSSVERGQPAVFPLERVIDGWKEGIQKINKGGRLKLYVPPELGYGDQPPPDGPIPPGAALAFEIELLEINPTPPGLPASTPTAPALPQN